jgi:NAD(P)-dependent dehydrogenase (short-subunit alcohol dehydrogenase family)
VISTDYAGQVVVVAAGAHGVGRAIADGFHRAGALVVIADVRAADPSSEFIEVDITDRASTESLARTVDERLGRADVLVNCGMAGRHQLALELTSADWSRGLGVILSGAFFSSQALAPIMAKQKKGTIINLVTVDAFHAFPGRASYAAAEAGLLGLTRALAVEWAALGIRVNALAHGIVAPEPEGSNSAGSRLVDRLSARTPMHRLARPEELAAAALFLAGPRAGFMTGQVLRVDGGWAALNSAVPGFVFP